MDGQTHCLYFCQESLCTRHIERVLKDKTHKSTFQAQIRPISHIQCPDLVFAKKRPIAQSHQDVPA
jgi:hypothetical protein